jgi:hypothetical protein
MGTLTVVGTGIRLGHISWEARTCIEKANSVLFLVIDPITTAWITNVNENAESLHVFYSVEKQRQGSYLEMVEHILSHVRKKKHVCAAFYGHPGVFAFPTHEAISRARREGFPARMLPGISAQDCLFADLGVDPAQTGCQTFEATEFLINNRVPDTSSSLILLQIGVIGDPGYKEVYGDRGLKLLAEVLQSHYGADHQAVVYEAPTFAICDPVSQNIRLNQLGKAGVTPLSTLYVPARVQASAHPDRIASIKAILGFNEENRDAVNSETVR